jgi:hypothetical protein
MLRNQNTSIVTIVYDMVLTLDALFAVDPNDRLRTRERVDFHLEKTSNSTTALVKTQHHLLRIQYHTVVTS